MENTNPLVKYFRQPAIYLKLPTRGKFWPETSLEMPVTGEIPVYPMTTKDEITLRTPDALMNGSGVIDVIHSCCPNIKNAWLMPSVDVDSVLIAIRIASYGHEMDIDTNCPFCNEENTHAVDLRVTLDNIICPDYSKKLEYEDLRIKLQPQPYFGVNKGSMIDYEEQRILRALEQTDLTPELKARQISESMSKLVEISIETITNSTEHIEMSDGTIVTNKQHILDYYTNSSGTVVKKVQTRLAEINESGGAKSPQVSCSSCSKQYTVPLEFDYANFFAKGS